MKRIFFLLIFYLLIFVSGFAQTNELSDEDIWKSNKFQPDYFPEIVPLKNTDQYCIMEADENNLLINKYDFATGNKIETIFNSKFISKNDSIQVDAISNFSLSDDASKILFSSSTESIYRHSSTSDFFVWDIKKQKLKSLTIDGKQQLAEFSPDGTKICFVKENNIFIKDLTNDQVTQVTNDGKFNYIINGATDWVYEEEFSAAKGFFWSSDGVEIAYCKFDESRVKEYTLTFYDSLYPTQYHYKYPKAGEDGSKVSVWIYNLKTQTSQKIEIKDDKDYYIPRIRWSNEPDKLAIFKMNRLQNEFDILMYDITNKNLKPIYQESNKRYVDIIHDFNGKYADVLTFLKNNDFIITSEKDGFNHIYLYKNDGTLKKQLTKGNWDVIEIEGVDEEKGIVYFISSEISPMDRSLYSVRLNGSDKKKISLTIGCNDVVFSGKYNYFLNTWSDANTPTISSIHRSDGAKIRELNENIRLNKLLNSFHFPVQEFFTFKTSQGVFLNGWMIKPLNMDKNKKYPVLMYVYGGPGIQTVVNEWGFKYSLWFRLLAQKGYIVISVDNRGTGSRGEEFKKCTYSHLGNIETEDQIEAAKYLGKLSYVDAARIGIFGWSYGGYLTALCMTKGADYFKTGVSVAPVTDWRFYDNIYTERFMGLPKDNSSNYKESSVLTYADLLKGNLLLIQGMADDNVHLQNSTAFINELINNNKSFESQFYPDRNHNIYGGNTRLHLFNRITEYILKNL